LKAKKLFNTNYILLFGYALIFFHLLYKGAIYYPDSPSYLEANIFRSPGYPIFTRLIQVFSQNYFDYAILTIQILFNLFAIHILYKKVLDLLTLNLVFKILLFAILVFPLFEPLLMANRICSEAISYPLYLLFISFTLHFLFKKNNRSLIFLSISYVLLVLTRGQFLLLPIIIAFIYVLKWRKSIFKQEKLIPFFILLFIPLLPILLDKSYHKVKDGVFISTPFKYVNAMASALYVSEASNVNLFKDPDLKHIFKMSHDFTAKNNWLMSSKERVSYAAYYNDFHGKLVHICNTTFHNKGTQYYLDKNQSIVKARTNIELAGKKMFPILIKNNFSKWFPLYLSNIIHGFKSVFLLIFIAIVLFFSGLKICRFYSDKFAILFLFSSFILINALIVSFVSHSIIRYLFYNYFLIFLIFVELYKLILTKKND